MTARSLPILALLLLLAGSGHAQSRTDLLFTINAALKAHNRVYFERCFNWEQSDPVSRGRAKAIIDEIFRWRSPYVITTERNPEAGANPRFNGEWLYQIHIHDGPPPSNAFVFPAGRVEEGNKILLGAG